MVALQPSGEVVARETRPTPRGSTDTNVSVPHLLAAIENMIVTVCGDRFRLHAVSVAGIGEDSVLVDADFTLLTTALAWFDPRRTSIYQGVVDQLAPSMRTCTSDAPAHTLVGWRWATDQRLVAPSRSWLALTDCPSAIWSGTPYMSDTLAARTAAWDCRSRSWIEPRVAFSLGSTSLLPAVLRAGSTVGGFRPGSLTETGVIAPDAVIVAGGHDHPIGGWSVHSLDSGSILDSMGTAEVVVVAQSSDASITRSDNIDIAAGIVSEGTTVSSVAELSRNIEWASRDGDVGKHLAAIIAGDLEPDKYLFDDSAFRPGGRGGGEPRYADHAPSSSLSRASAVAGALARRGEQTLTFVANRSAGRPHVYAAGGWSGSPGWVRAKEAGTGRTVTVVPEPQVTATAAALLAAKAIGWQPSPSVALGVSSDLMPV